MILYQVRPTNEILVSYPLPPAAYFIPPYQGLFILFSSPIFHWILVSFNLVSAPLFVPVAPTDRPFLINVTIFFSFEKDLFFF